MARDAVVDLLDAVANGGIGLGERKERTFTELSDDPSQRDLYSNLHLGFTQSVFSPAARPRTVRKGSRLICAGGRKTCWTEPLGQGRAATTLWGLSPDAGCGAIKKPAKR